MLSILILHYCFTRGWPRLPEHFSVDSSFPFYRKWPVSWLSSSPAMLHILTWMIYDVQTYGCVYESQTPSLSQIITFLRREHLLVASMFYHFCLNVCSMVITIIVTNAESGTRFYANWILFVLFFSSSYCHVLQYAANGRNQNNN